MKEPITFTLNGKSVRITTDPQRTLLWVLRDDFGLTGTKYGCGEGLCGACTVLVGADPVRACQITLGEVADGEVTTIEGLALDGALHPVQEAFVAHDALQCGFCTPGMIMNAVGLLMKNPDPDRATIDEQMNGNLCRCGAHVRIIEAIRTAAHSLGGDPR